ncbi:MAG: Gfo/Idh/MocA family oxidoreductase [Bacteroidetes bacterium]|nr:Gfo/Idh/MocA family oxidoreductase [Bacteroidota bacterium]MBS1631493.1 Gfo/Idh/MocA family oxidoreductase [Bacteroidota bacterium]
MRAFKTGICSFGLSGKIFHAPFIQAHPGFELTAIVERHKNDSQAKYPGTTIYRSVEELCANKEIEFIIVNTPSYLHFEHAKIALSAGKNILVEKPFTITVKEAEELIALAEKMKLKITVYQNKRYDGDYRAVKDVIEKKLLGDLCTVDICYDRYRPNYGGKPHKEGALPGAGIIFDLGPHLIYQALQLFGPPDALFADIWKIREDVAAPDYFKIILYYKKLRVSLMATSISREPMWGYVLQGRKGSFLQKRSDLQEVQLREGAVPSLQNWCIANSKPDGLLHTEINGNVIRKEITTTPGNYMELFDDLYKFLTGMGKNPVPPEDGLKTIRIIEMAFQSAIEGRVVTL